MKSLKSELTVPISKYGNPLQDPVDLKELSPKA
jgi:hypothetical protein